MKGIIPVVNIQSTHPSEENAQRSGAWKDVPKKSSSNLQCPIVLKEDNLCKFKQRVWRKRFNETIETIGSGEPAWGGEEHTEAHQDYSRNFYSGSVRQPAGGPGLPKPC